MYEVELKLRADHGPVRDALSQREATPAERVVQVDTYFDAPHRSFAETDEALRLRRERVVPADGETRDGDGETAVGDGPGRETAVLTYKGPLVEAASKTRRELQTGVESGEELEALLGALGFEPAATVTKERERYDLEGYTLGLDAVEGLGEFVEIECEVESEGDIAPAREGAASLLADLGLDPDDQVRTSYLGLLLAED
ncbi:MAG: class IV adenylate cyclase [Halobacteriaceae archaeon]